MATNLADVLTTAKDGGSVHITLVSNQNNGIASYAEGSLIFHKATGGKELGHPFHPAHLESANPIKMYFSDRKLSIDSHPTGGFDRSPRQPFNANQTEILSVSVNTGFGDHKTIIVSIIVFGHTARFNMEQLGDLYVGIGPSLSLSSGAAFVLSFTGITNPPA